MADSYMGVLTESGFARTADIARIRVTGDIEVRVRLRAATWEDGLNRAGLIGRWSGSAPNRSYRLKLAVNGSITFEVGEGPTTRQKISSVSSWTNGLIYDIRATLDLTDGVNSIWNFYRRQSPTVALTSNTGWSLVSQHTDQPVSGINAGNQPLEMPCNEQRRMTGDWFRTLVYSGIDGTIVSDWSPRDPATMQTPGDESAWLDQAPSAANVISMQGTEVTDWAYTDLSGGGAAAVAGAKLSHEVELEAAGILYQGAFAPYTVVRPPAVVAM